MTAVRCVVFDVDDTLYLERDYVYSGFSVVGRWAAVKFGIDDFFERAWRLFECGVRRTIFDEVLAAAQLTADQQLLDEMVTMYRRHRPSIALLDDSRRVLDALHGVIALAAVTDGPLESQTAKIAALGLDRWLDPIICTAARGASFTKPSRLAFEEIEEATGCRGDGCMYVADNPHKDFAGPKDLGWRTVRVRRPASLHCEQPSGTDVDVEVSDLDGLVCLVGVR